MIITFTKTSVVVIREIRDKRYYGNRQATGESRLFYDIKKQLNMHGYNLIKKRMWKDGHLVDDCQQYLRTRKKTKDPNKNIMIWNTFFQIRGANEDFNKGKVVLGLEKDIFDTTLTTVIA